ncbi:hypothetical protein CE91St38_06770 [Desulfovibrionaceae bacterium]|nr:hypothetical protein CE91St38_06770 [Desulfovibrionaceae bacterium]GKI11220.1 hypothetical protein CE91St39_06740 [Desulfovibrionaceae bacterium]
MPKLSPSRAGQEKSTAPSAFFSTRSPSAPSGEAARAAPAQSSVQRHSKAVGMYKKNFGMSIPPAGRIGRKPRPAPAVIVYSILRLK